MIKRLIKSALQNTVAFAGPHRWRGSGQLVILMYHRVLPPDDPRYQDEQPGMIVHPDTFDMHLATMKRYFTVVDLAEWLQRADSGDPLPDRAIAITFDDGWRDNHEYAQPILERHNAPATIFLVSDMVGSTGNYWPEQLATAIRVAHDGEPDLWDTDPFAWLRDLHPPVVHADNPERIDAAIVSAKARLNDATLRDRSTAMLNALGDPHKQQPRALLDWSEIREMGSASFSFGSHTIDHTRLTDTLDDEAIEHQLVASKQALEAEMESPVTLFCYPNGDHAPAAVRYAEQHYDAAVTTVAGWNTANTHRHTLRRIGVHEGNSETPDAFLARLSGWI
ncbi:MAG: polysaccharide deacetylase family protein [Pseudomonadota bacterium]